jgi:hypothetical protein
MRNIELFNKSNKAYWEQVRRELKLAYQLTDTMYQNFKGELNYGIIRSSKRS